MRLFKHESCSENSSGARSYNLKGASYGYDVAVRTGHGWTPPGRDRRVQKERVARAPRVLVLMRVHLFLERASDALSLRGRFVWSSS